MTDLFTPPSPTDAAQDALRIAMQAAWDRDCDLLSAQGILPPWQESDNMLDRDERQLLTHIADNCGLDYDKRTITALMGFSATGNYLATEGKCLSRKLIRFTSSADGVRLNLTSYGRWVLDRVEEDDVDDMEGSE